MSKTIRVLVVDDSMLFRRTIVEGLSKDPLIEVVAMAADPYEARDAIIKYRPDVMTLDVEMPKMNGIDFLKKLIPQYPMPVIMVSAVDDKVFEALKYGALDFVVKSAIASNTALDAFLDELTKKVKSASEIIVKKPTASATTAEMPETPIRNPKKGIDIIAIGASTGGTEATETVIKKLPGNLPPILIVQHMPPVFTKMYAERLNRSSRVNVQEAKSGDVLTYGHAYVAPGASHMKLVKTGNKTIIKCFESHKVNGHMPSVDVTFASVAQYYNDNSIGIILTGMGNDGARGLLAMRQAGAKTIGQDEGSSVVYGMPKKAYEIGAVSHQSPISVMHQKILTHFR